ncbi:MAG: SPOR domain-containing protein, partial [Flavobacteriaceae bacterium]
PSRADPQPTAPKPVAPAAPMPSAARSAATQPPAEPAVRSADASPDVDRLLADISAAHATHIEQNDDFDFDEAFGENDEGFVWYDEPAAAAEPSRDSAAYRSAPARAEESAADWDVPARQTGHDEADIDEQEEEERESFQADDYEDGEAAMFEAEDADPYAALGSFPVRARPAVHAAAVPAPGPESRASNPAAKVQTPPPAVELGEPVHFEPDAPAAAPEPNAQALWPEAQRRQEQPAAPEAKAPVAEPRHSTAQPGPRVTGAATAAYAAAPRAQAHPAPRIESGPRFEAVERAPAARDLRDDAHFEAMMEQELDFSEFDPSFDDSGHMPPLSDEEAADFGTHPGTERTGRSRGIFLVGALVALIVAGGAGVLAYNSIFSETAGGEPPTLAARDGPVKTKPADPGGAEIPNQNKLVYDRLGGNDQPAEERVVPREEQVDQPSGDSPVRVIGTNVVPRGEEGRVASEQIPSARDATLASQPTADQKAAAPLTAAPAPDQPKRVKTVVVKPDGTVIGQPQAPVTPAPVQLPSAPQRVADAPAAPSRQSEDASAARDAQAPAPTQQVNNVPSGRPLSLTPSNINNAAPSPTPAPAAAPTRVAAAQPAAPVSTSAGPAGTYVVQVASRKSEDQAQSAVSSIQSRYNSALGGHVPRIERADLGDKGVYYRVGVGPISSQQEAVSICERLKSAGQDCFVRRN